MDSAPSMVGFSKAINPIQKLMCSDSETNDSETKEMSSDSETNSFGFRN